MNTRKARCFGIRRWAGALGLALLMFVSTHAMAQDFADPHDLSARAESHYQLAVRFFGEGRYREAVEEFDRAIAMMPEAIFYCNRAVVLIKLDEMEEALRSMGNCREKFDGDPEELHQIDAQTQALEVVVRFVRIRAVTVARDVAEPSGVVARPVTPPAGTPWGASQYGYLSLGVGAGLLVGAATLDWVSADLREDFISQSRGGSGTSKEEYDTLEARLRTRQQLFYGLAGSGAVLTTAGVGLLTYHVLAADRDRSVRAMVLPGVGGDPFGMTLLLSF
ncbi:MAG: tetratricopeptide repeat protein, partial [Bradymonadaceae bacterium]